MQIQLRKTSNDRSFDIFVETYLPEYIYKEFINRFNPTRAQIFDRVFNMNSFSILQYALRHLLISKVRNDTYIIKINKSLRYNNVPVGGLVNLITYGTRQVRGYGIIDDIFKYVSENINGIYNTWLLGIK